MVIQYNYFFLLPYCIFSVLLQKFEESTFPLINNKRLIKTKNMKSSKLLIPFLLLFFLVEITVSAQTYMPDDNFEAWCELHGYGDNIPNNVTHYFFVN